ncbi:MAG: hypothetical protein ABI682_14845 [Acidobacteriota bacterium]
MSFEREHVTLLIDRKRLAIYRVFVGRPGTAGYRVVEKGWTELKALSACLVAEMGVPSALAAAKISELERSGGPASFDYRRPALPSGNPVRPDPVEPARRETLRG